jgi:hypothetical protein
MEPLELKNSEELNEAPVSASDITESSVEQVENDQPPVKKTTRKKPAAKKKTAETGSDLTSDETVETLPELQPAEMESETEVIVNENIDEKEVAIIEPVEESLDEPQEIVEAAPQIETGEPVSEPEPEPEMAEIKTEVLEESPIIPEIEIDNLPIEIQPLTEEPPAEEVEEIAEENTVEDQITLLEEPADIPDFSEYSEVELVNALREIIGTEAEEDKHEEIEAIKSAFYRKHKAKIEQQRKDFALAGGNIEEFVPGENPYETDMKELLQSFRNQRIELNRKIEDEKEQNYQKKIDIIEELKRLINKEESINRTFQEFREIQRRWHEIGLVPQSKMKDLWETYHFHIENFYDYIKINKELRDLDLRKNLEIKMELCEKAEELLLEPSIIKAFNNLQKYHERWREVGPVPNDKKEEIWERFKAATTKINKKHQDFFEKRKNEQKNNLEAKTALCEKAEEFSGKASDPAFDWENASREVVQLQKLWRTIGFAPRKENNKIYERFRKACDTFFDKKREYFSRNKEVQQNNLQMKIDLCIQAEALRESDDWKKTTQDYIDLQKKWKEIGPVPRKQSDIVWKRFRAACDFFFDKKAEHFSSLDSEQIKNLQDKQKLIEDVRNFRFSGNLESDLKILKEYQRQWTEIGHVPIKYKNDVQVQFREAINKHFDELNMEDGQRSKLKFRSKMSNLSETNRGINKMRLEREKYAAKLKQLESDLTLLDNNIGFFSQSKNAMSLIADVTRKIEQTKEKIAFLKEKIRIIDDLDESEE